MNYDKLITLANKANKKLKSIDEFYDLVESDIIDLNFKTELYNEIVNLEKSLTIINNQIKNL